MDETKISFKKHAPSIREDEKMIFLSLIDEYKDIILCRDMKSDSNRRKKTAWIEITEKFNKKATSASRSTITLQKYWDNLKRTRKDEVSAMKREQHKTGGGPPPEEISTTSKMIDNIYGDAADTYFFGEPLGIDTLSDAQLDQSNMNFEIITTETDENIDHSNMDSSVLTSMPALSPLAGTTEKKDVKVIGSMKNLKRRRDNPVGLEPAKRTKEEIAEELLALEQKKTFAKIKAYESIAAAANAITTCFQIVELKERHKLAKFIFENPNVTACSYIQATDDGHAENA